MTDRWRKCNPTNEAETCVWCGQKLRHRPIYSVREDGQLDKTGIEADGGSYADGLFCGLRCGYLFGLNYALSGHRLMKK